MWPTVLESANCRYRRDSTANTPQVTQWQSDHLFILKIFLIVFSIKKICATRQVNSSTHQGVSFFGSPECKTEEWNSTDNAECHVWWDPCGNTSTSVASVWSAYPLHVGRQNYFSAVSFREVPPAQAPRVCAQIWLGMVIHKNKWGLLYGTILIYNNLFCDVIFKFILVLPRM